MTFPPRTGSISRSVIGWLAVSAAVGGEVKFDGSFGRSDALPGPNFMVPADGGRRVGANLFHSFSKLDLSSGESANFQGPAGVGNILARITDGAASSIDGTLRSEIAGANLFLINPAGVIFGPEARLEVSGSFAVTTADFVRLSDGGKFTARLGSEDSLTSAPVSAFGFLSAAPSAVRFNGSRLVVPEGRDLTVVAGDLTLDGALAAAPSGRLSLVSAAAAGEVPASPDTLAASPAAVLPTMGTIEVRNGSFANINGNGGGRIVIRGGRLQVAGGSLIASENSGSAPGGSVDVRLTDSLIIQDGRIASSAVGSARGGDVKVKAPAMSIGGTAFVSGIFASTASTLGARGGNLDVRSSDLALTAGGTISTTTFGLGDGGDIRVLAERLRIDREGSPIQTGVFAAVAPGAIGRGGNIMVKSADATLLGGGVISGDTLGQGDGGNITIRAARLRLDPASSGLFTGITSTVSQGAIGDGGDIIVASEDVAVTAGASIAANTLGRGNGGNIHLTARTLRIDGLGIASNTGVFASVSPGAVGRGGDIMIETKGFTLVDGGVLAANTFGQGDGGGIQVTADRMRIDGRGSDFSAGLFAAVGVGAVGRGGDIVVRSQNLAIVNGGAMVADTFGQGNGGNLKVIAPRLRIDGRGSGRTTGIVADVGFDAVGNGGGVTVRSGDLAILRGAQISSNIFGIGDGGGVRVSADRLRIEGRGAGAPTGIFAAVSAGARGNGGDLHVVATDLSMVGGAAISADNAGRGLGGTVNIAAQRLHLNGLGLDAVTAISSDLSPGAVGRGGDLIIRGNEVSILGGATVSTDTFGIGDGGRITVAADRLFIDGSGSASFTGISSEVDASAIGDGGAITIHVGEFTLLGEAFVSTDTFGRGDGGQIEVSADRLLIDGQGGDFFTTISSEVGAGAIGRGGDIVLRAGEISLRHQAGVSAITSGFGGAGSIRVEADVLRIDGNSAPLPTGITSSVFPGAVGDGGPLSISVGQLTLRAGGTIFADTLARGDGGPVTVHAARLNIDSAGSPLFTGISSGVGPGAVGGGGDLLITGDDVRILGAGRITAATVGGGDAGSVRLRVSDLHIDTSGATIEGGIFANVEAGSTGRGGSVDIEARTLSLRGNTDSQIDGGIIAQSNTSAPAGSVNLKVGNLSLTQSALISSANVATGNAGSVRIAARDALTMDEGSQISVFSQSGDAGSIALAGRRIELHDRSSVIASAGANGGSIDISARDLFHLDHSALTATAGSELSSGSAGRGGNITVDPIFIILDHATISANAALGRGGNILLVADNFFSSESTLTATGSTAGTVEIASPELDLAAGLVILPGAFVNASTQLREQCAARLGMDFSSFLVIGRGGVSLNPDEPLPSE